MRRDKRCCKCECSNARLEVIQGRDCDCGRSRKERSKNLNSGTHIDNVAIGKKVLVFGVLCATSIPIWWHALVITYGLALANDGYTHILLIFPLSTALIYVDAKWIGWTALQVKQEFSPRLGTTLLVLALLVGCCARWVMGGVSEDARASVAMFGLVSWWIASVVLCFGVKTLELFLFPLCFLFLMIPIPAATLSWMIEFLQHESALAAKIMFRVAGVRATQDGIMLFIPNLTIEVARECSSIRSSLMLVITSMVLVHLFLRSWWRKLLVVALAVPLSIAKNGFRIFVIAELGTKVDPSYFNGNLHHHGGIVFFGLSVIVMAALIWMVRKTEVPADGASSLPAELKFDVSTHR